MSDYWGELASAMYEHLGWGRDMFKLDYGMVEGSQHDSALEGLVGEAILEYLYAEFDDGKDVLTKMAQEMWHDVKARVPIDSRRWFLASSKQFGKELNRLKQALAYKGFAIDRGTVGRGNAKRRVLEIRRLDDSGSSGVNAGSTKSEFLDPAESGLDKPESARPEGVESRGSRDSLSLSGMSTLAILRHKG